MTKETAGSEAAAGQETRRDWGPRLLQALCTLLILAVGVAIALVFLKLKKPPRAVISTTTPGLPSSVNSTEEAPQAPDSWITLTPPLVF